MDKYNPNYNATVTRSNAAIDVGLRNYMLGVYNYMAIGLVVTGIVAFAVYSLAVTETMTAGTLLLSNGKILSPLGVALYTSPLSYVLMFLPLIAIFFFNFKISSLSASAARMFFFAFALMIGVSLSSIFVVYVPGSILSTFFITAASFAALSLYGYTTKRDLSPFRSFLVIGVVGIIIAMIVNLFIQSSALDFAISVIGVLVFAGLTAFNTQATKEMYYVGDSQDTRSRKIVIGALALYISFINMFTFLLNLLGNRN